MTKKTIEERRAQGVWLSAVLILATFLSNDALAHTGDLFQEEIGKVEQLFTGGYMRLGLLGVCGVTAIMWAIQQSAWMFLSGILAGVFAYFMKDWIMATFTFVICVEVVISDYDQHLILHHLDDPLRILHWTLDEAFALIFPTFLGLGVERPTLGLMAAGFFFWSLKNIKKRFGLSTLKHAVYWHLPKNNRKLPHMPPSYIREYVG